MVMMIIKFIKCISCNGAWGEMCCAVFTAFRTQYGHREICVYLLQSDFNGQLTHSTACLVSTPLSITCYRQKTAAISSKLTRWVTRHMLTFPVESAAHPDGIFCCFTLASSIYNNNMKLTSCSIRDAKVDTFMPLTHDHLCQLASKSLYTFSKYRVY